MPRISEGQRNNCLSPFLRRPHAQLSVEPLLGDILSDLARSCLDLCFVSPMHTRSSSKCSKPGREESYMAKLDVHIVVLFMMN
jgi:hypothetical protein